MLFAHVTLRTQDADCATGHHTFEFRAVLGTVKALRFAPPTRSAWPSGLDGALRAARGLLLRDGQSGANRSGPLA